jgi:hypothetical protein
MSRPLTETTLKVWRKAIESKWKAQGEIGSTLHAVSEFYFGKTNGVYNFEEIDQDPQAAYSKFPNDLKKGNKINPDIFLKALTMC